MYTFKWFYYIFYSFCGKWLQSLALTVPAALEAAGRSSHSCVLSQSQWRLCSSEGSESLQCKVQIPCKYEPACLSLLLSSSETPPWWRCDGESKAWARRRSGPSPKMSCRCPWPWRTLRLRSKRSPNLCPPQTWKNTRRGWQSLGLCKENLLRGLKCWKKRWKPWR